MGYGTKGQGDDLKKNSEPTLSDRTFTAATWTIGGRLFARLLDFVILVIVARLLSPADFGLVATAMTAVVIAESVLELPLFQVLVRTPTQTKPMLDTAFTLSIIRCMAIATVLGGLSFPISWFYNEPKLLPLICVLSLAPVFRGSQSPGMVYFMRRMDFRPDFVMNVAGKIVAMTVSTSVAFLTESYWAIALGTIATPLTINLISYCVAPYSPRFRLSEWSLFAKTVGWSSASQFMVAIGWQLDRIVLARFVPALIFGRFTLAGDLSAIPLQALVVPITGPLLAAFSPRTGSESLRNAYLKSSNALFAIASPPLLIMGLLSEHILYIVLGAKWIEAAPFLRWLSLTTILVLPVAPMPSLALAMDQARLVTLRASVELALKIPVTLIAILTNGIMGAIVARGILAFVTLLVSMGVVRKLVELSVPDQLIGLLRTIVALAVMAICIALLSPKLAPSSTAVDLVFSTAWDASVGIVVYTSVLLMLWRAYGFPAGIEATLIRSLKLLSRWI